MTMFLVFTHAVVHLEVQNRYVHRRTILAKRLEQFEQAIEDGGTHEVAACIAKVRTIDEQVNPHGTR